MKTSSTPKFLIVCADDFGLDVTVNEAVETANRGGILTCTSLMMGEAAVDDAVARAKRLPNLAVGLHITLTAGHSVLPYDQIPDLVGPDRRFDDNMARTGVRYFFLPHVRKQLRAEIRAQFEAFRATGLALDHVNAHRHFHLHPTLTRMITEIGCDYGLKSMRVPYEPTPILRLASPNEKIMPPIYQPWVLMLGTRLRRAGVVTNDSVFGLRWSGAMTTRRVQSLLKVLPDGVTELYLHPATERTQPLVAAMPDYQHVAEYQALMDAGNRTILDEHNIQLTTYGALAAGRA